MNILFLSYNICLIIFGFGAFLDPNPVKNSKYQIATLMIGSIGILGALLFFFPQDPRGTTATLAGNVHIFIAGILSLLTIVAVFLNGWGLKSIDGWQKFVGFSYFTSLLIIVSGGLAAYAVATNSFYGGLAERITIFAFMIWVMVFSYLLLTRTPSVTI
jgi:hypothetical protein